MHRTCIVGDKLDVKICCFGSVINQTAYAADYCYIDEAHHSLPMPIRWMAWESVLLVCVAVHLYFFLLQ